MMMSVNNTPHTSAVPSITKQIDSSIKKTTLMKRKESEARPGPGNKSNEKAANAVENDDCSALTSVESAYVTNDDLNDEPPKTFPQKLMEMLNDKQNNNAICWLSHGKAFIIYKKKSFSEEVLPKYFQACKYTSFTRKLNRWGFTRVTRGPEMGSYYHPKFLRDDPKQCLQMCSSTGVGAAKFSPMMFPGVAPQGGQNLVPMMPGGMPFMGYFPGMMPFGMTMPNSASNSNSSNSAQGAEDSNSVMMHHHQMAMFQQLQQFQQFQMQQFQQAMQQYQPPQQPQQLQQPEQQSQQQERQLQQVFPRHQQPHCQTEHPSLPSQSQPQPQAPLNASNAAVVPQFNPTGSMSSQSPTSHQSINNSTMMDQILKMQQLQQQQQQHRQQEQQQQQQPQPQQPQTPQSQHQGQPHLPQMFSFQQQPHQIQQPEYVQHLMQQQQQQQEPTGHNFLTNASSQGGSTNNGMMGGNPNSNQQHPNSNQQHPS